MSRGLNVFVSIGAKLLPSLNSAATATERRFGLMSRRMRLTAAEVSGSWKGMENRFARFNQNVSLPAAAMAGLGARAVYEWSKVGNELQAVTQMSDQARARIEAVARAMPGNPAENLSAALDLARTGFDEKAIMGSLGVTLKLGRADSSVDQAEAADILTNVMKGMKLSDGTLEQITRSANRAANNIAFAAARSSSDVRLMGESFKYAAPLAAKVGIPIEELSAYFMTMADNGIKGSEAGVAFRSGMVRLLKPTKAANAVLAKHNMRLSDYVKGQQKLTGGGIVAQLKAGGVDASGAKGEIDRLLASDLSGAELTQKITEAVAAGMEGGADATDLDKLSDAVGQALTSGADKIDFAKFLADAQAKGWSTSDLVHFFDVRQGARLSTLFGPDFQRNLNALKALGNIADGRGTFLDKMYGMQMQGAVGPWEKMKQGFGNLFISMAESGVLTTIADGMNSIASGLMSLSKSNPGLLKFATYAILAAAVMAPLGFALSGIAASFGLFAGGARLAITVLAPLVNLAPMLLNGLARLAPLVIRGLMAAFALLSNPVGWAVILAGVAAALIWYFWDDLKAAWPKVVNFFKTAFTGIKNWILSINWSGIGWKIANGLTFGLASKLKGANWGGIIKGALGGFALGGPVGALAGGALGGARAGGGGVNRGKSYLVGEYGPEVFTPGATGTITTNRRLEGALAGSRGGGGNMSPTINIYGVTEPGAVGREVERVLRRLSDNSGNLSD